MYFQCEDQLKKYTRRSIKKYLCNGKGDELKVLIMPFYKLGSFKDFPWNTVEIKNVLSCVAQIMTAYLHAYNKIGFLHNDCHLGNILIDETTEKEFIYIINDNIIKIPLFGYKIIVMDFENSILDIKRQNTDTLLNSIVLILANCVNTHNKNSNADLYIYKAMRRVSLLVNKNNYLEVINIINLLLGSFEEL